MNARQLQKVPMNVRRWWRGFGFLLLVAALATYTKVPMNVRRTIRNRGWWLGFGLLLLVAALAIYAVNR